jgi:hypothetical protein
MFRITRGMHVQHIHFPYPVMRDLDDLEDDGTREDADPPESADHVAVQDEPVDADVSTETTQWIADAREEV